MVNEAPPPPPGDDETSPSARAWTELDTGATAASGVTLPPVPSTVPEASTAVPAVATTGLGATAQNPSPIVDNVDHSLDPRSVTLSRIGSFIAAAIFSGLALVGAVVAIVSSPVRWPLALGLWLSFTLLLAVRAWFWPALAYRHTSYRLNSRGLVIRRGVLWRSVAHVPRSRVQHTDVSQGPLERYFELGTLTVHTAGTQFASVSLGGLKHETADRIRDVLIDGGDEDGV